MKKRILTLLLICTMVLSLTGCESKTLDPLFEKFASEETHDNLLSLEYEGAPATEVNKNKPYFTDDEISQAKDNDLKFDSLDILGRTGTAYGVLNESMMPDDESREDIDPIKPSGWIQVKYDGIDNGGWLYNRCHLIAWSLTGENDNEKNLMTGTRYFNVEGMLPYEVKVLEYVRKNPDNHVLYRATPIYSGSELLARGLLLECFSIEDDGKLSFCVYIHNVQPGIDIDYATGKSKEKGEQDKS